VCLADRIGDFNSHPSHFYHSSRLKFFAPHGTNNYFLLSFPKDIFFGGWVVGLVQWIALRQILPYRNFRLAALWILGGWLSIELGNIAILIWRSAPININSGMLFDTTPGIEGVYIGVVSGFVTGVLLLLVIHRVGKTEGTTSPLSENKWLIDGFAAE
jgi:hypothetical protein